MEAFKFTSLKATCTTSDSITIEWEVETMIPTEKISFEAGLIEETEGRYDLSDLLQTTNSYTFSDLDADREYSVFIRAYEEPDHLLLVEYPQEGCKVRTLVAEPPGVKNEDVEPDTENVLQERQPDDAEMPLPEKSPKTPKKWSKVKIALVFMAGLIALYFVLVIIDLLTR